MASITATATQLNGHYANQYPNHNNNKLIPPHLPHNKAYTQYAPNFIIALSALYLIAFLLHYFLKKCRKYRDKKQQREKQHLKSTWKKAIAKFEIYSKNDSNVLYPDSTYNKQQSYISSASSFTLNNHSSPASSSSITATTAAISINIDTIDKKHCPHYNSNRHQPSSPSSSSLCSFTTADTTTVDFSKIDHQHHPVIGSVEKEPKDDVHGGRLSRHMFGSETLTNYWKINNNKRLSLLWQWSVAMGYCEYSHAKILNNMVQQLQR
ncbi:hypothetical protein INT46_008212 [Mucor plumbeus]|uniref:Uncharacterized protein n=1 Tax=Mucor plumbeus TaxID=97098 RepID=A0A8H7USL8_9FUNG|nr:hypothetical protein INT46_008212 [Mucor plumbeus]